MFSKALMRSNAVAFLSLVICMVPQSKGTWRDSKRIHPKPREAGWMARTRSFMLGCVIHKTADKRGKVGERSMTFRVGCEPCVQALGIPAHIVIELPEPLRKKMSDRNIEDHAACQGGLGARRAIARLDRRHHPLRSQSYEFRKLTLREMCGFAIFADAAGNCHRCC